jgi:hypothetical protein
MSSDESDKQGPRPARADQAAQPPTDRTPPAPARRRPGPFIPFARFEDIVVRCGHTEKFGLLPEGKDRFREDRRKKALGRDCKSCREKKQQQEQEVARLRRAEKEKSKAQESGQEAAKARGPRTGRLPHGARFEVVYDAAKQQWTGSLTIPTPDGTAVAFSGSGSGLFPLLASLDTQYRATLS